MSEPRPERMERSSDRGYKRSWKNLLINRSIQLRFTLFMVGLAAVLMVGLGVWVMRVANETSEVSTASVRGKACPKLPLIDENAAGETGDAAPPSHKPEEAAAPETRDGAAGDSPSAASSAPAVPAPEAAGSAAPVAPAPSTDSATGSAGSAAPVAAPAKPDDEPRHVTVQIDESSMTLTLPPDLADQIAAHWTCELRQVGRLDRLNRDRQLIQWAMVVTGLILVLGLAFYGIKMTHRVAGPLFKVGLYFHKMRQGRFDKVYNLRKGDQLVEFYDHFKLAHDGVVEMQRDDIARIAAVVKAAEAAGAGGHPAVDELRELLARKEKSIE